MRTVIVLALLVSSSSCATKRAPATARAPVTMRYVFVESLPPETQVCVHSTPWTSELACWSLGEFRTTVRGIRRASADPYSPPMDRP